MQRSIWGPRVAVILPVCSTARGSIWPRRYRFGNAAVPMAGHLYWDLPHLWQQIGMGLRKTAEAYPGQIATIGLDTWGVDFGLLGRGDELLGNPYTYRDTRTNGMLEAALARVPRERSSPRPASSSCRSTRSINCWPMRVGNSPLLAEAKTFLMMPDLFNWLLTGEKLNERTDATTTQAFDPRTADWAWDMLDRIGIPTDMFCPIVQPGTRLGPLRAGAGRRMGIGRRPKSSLPGTHDTASAVVSVPAAAGVGRSAELVLHQFGHVVADGRRDSASGSRRPLPRVQLHQRRGSRRHDSAAEEYRRAVAGAGVPADLEQPRREP